MYATSRAAGKKIRRSATAAPITSEEAASVPQPNEAAIYRRSTLAAGTLADELCVAETTNFDCDRTRTLPPPEFSFARPVERRRSPTPGRHTDRVIWNRSPRTIQLVAIDIEVQRLELGDVIMVAVSDRDQEVEATVVRDIVRRENSVLVTLRVADADDFVKEWPLGETVTVVRGP